MFAPKHLRRVVPGHSLALWPILNPAVDRRWVYMASQQLRLASLQDCGPDSGIRGEIPGFRRDSRSGAPHAGAWGPLGGVCRPCASCVAAFPRRNGVFRAGEI